MKFNNTFKYKLIYVFRINDEAHKGALKIGQATLHTTKKYYEISNNCSELNQAAKERINSYTNTAGIRYELLHTELAIREEETKTGKELKAFSDYDVHKVLNKSGIEKVKINNTTGTEWYLVDLETVRNAIIATKENKKSLDASQITEGMDPIVFRPEQDKAIKDTIKQFKTGTSMLWNAKMRFGKTLTALQVVKEMEFSKTLIITHRPVVDKGWYEDFTKIFYDRPEYSYCSNEFGESSKELLKSDAKVVCFYSMQDLRGSKRVGGIYEKNEIVFDTNWDLVVVDEAHEGTKTALGDSVIKQIVKQDNGYDTKFLALSGTPFNILNEYDKNIYTWDYVMEQKAKHEWDDMNFGDSNPYESLPELKIYTYNLGDIINSKDYIEIEDKAFNFREFFRTWRGIKAYDLKDMPVGTNVGDFYHENDVRSFLDLITKKDENSMYPYSTDENRQLFKHSLWMVPGVREAKALSKLMKSHPVFGSNKFKIVNVAGEGDEEEQSEEALKKVKKAIAEARENDDYTITLSCGKLTTGVTIPEWTAVLMLAGSFSTSAAQYLQTIFRVQSPANIDGRIKDACYVFDFAPDRTLKMVADAVKVSHKAGQGDDNDRKIMGEFLNYCPVISIDGTEMRKYDENHLLQQLKRAYADRVVRNGFDDINIYNDELLKLDEIELQEFLNLKKIIGTTKAQQKTSEVDINAQGFTEEEYQEIERINKKPLRMRTPEELEYLKQLQEKKKQKRDAISILRGISIRIPLLIYGADFDIDEDITVEKLVENVDEISWNEFMPQDVTKEVFKKFLKYYDKDVFVAAGKRIRNTVKSADELEPTERIQKITQLFACFKNPDKETVLTPWRVVNMHMSDCIGGYDFFDENHKEIIEEPRFVEHGDITRNIFDNESTRILEINSKTGLYPLYITYTVYRKKCEKYTKEQLTMELKNKLWYDSVTENVFVICKTPMAKQITRRTLLGYKEGKINAHAFDDLVNQVQNKREYFINRIKKCSFWNKKGDLMKFNAIVGNPPYQLQGGSGGNNDAPLFQCFANIASKLEPDYNTLVIPSRWFAAGRGNLLDEFRKDMLNNTHIQKMFVYPDSNDIFSNVEIKGGICYYLINNNYDGECEYSVLENNEVKTNMRKLNEFDILIRDAKQSKIVKQIYEKIDIEKTLDKLISNDTPFGIGSNPKTSKKNPIKVYVTETQEHNTLLYHIENSKRKIEYVARELITKNKEYIDKHKVFIPGAAGSGNDSYILGKPEYAPPNSVCSQSYLFAAFETKEEAENFIKYLRTKFLRFLVSAYKITQGAPSKVYRFVPIQDFLGDQDVDWDKSICDIDRQLYNKYNLTEEEIEYIESKIKILE